MVVAAGAAQAPAAGAGALAAMVSAVQRDRIERLDADAHGRWLAAMLMTARPSRCFVMLREGTALRRFLPELEALFGVPQLSDEPHPIDVGEHQLRLMDQTAVVQAPLAVRFAALAHKLGKAGTPREIWPHHYRHEQRGQALLSRLLERSRWPVDAVDLARLAIDEADRVHRVSDRRAGPIAAMLQRLQALERPARFDRLLCLCACDYAAYPGHAAGDYPKAPTLRRALGAYASAAVEGLDADSALEARAVAIDRALRPRRDDAPPPAAPSTLPPPAAPTP